MDSSGGEPYRPEDHDSDRPDPLAAAKRRMRQRIHDDRRRYPEDLRPVFEALAAGLFEPGFDIKESVPDSGARRRFRIEVGVSPRAYRDGLLLETALELVQRTSLPFLEISAGLGFADPELFTKWFRWRTGKAPLTMRAPAGSPDDGTASAEPVAVTDGDRPWTVQECRRAAAWDVSQERGVSLIEKIRELYPALAADDPPLSE